MITKLSGLGVGAAVVVVVLGARVVVVFAVVVVVEVVVVVLFVVVEGAGVVVTLDGGSPVGSNGGSTVSVKKYPKVFHINFFTLYLKLLKIV